MFNTRQKYISLGIVADSLFLSGAVNDVKASRPASNARPLSYNLVTKIFIQKF